MKLKKLRLENDLTQEEVANANNITRFTYSNYESEKTQPDLKTLVKLADYFKVTVDALLEHEVPYLFDKSTLTEQQRVILDLLPYMNDRICEKAEAYINGLLEGEKDRQTIIQKLKK